MTMRIVASPATPFVTGRNAPISTPSVRCRCGAFSVRRDRTAPTEDHSTTPRPARSRRTLSARRMARTHAHVSGSRPMAPVDGSQWPAPTVRAAPQNGGRHLGADPRSLFPPERPPDSETAGSRRPAVLVSVVRSSVRNHRVGLYSTSRGRPPFRPAQDAAPAGRRPRLARGVQPGRPRLVRRDVRRANARPGRGLGGDLGRPPHADPRADRERQDPRRVPVVPRPARARPDPAGDPRAARPRPGALRLAAQGAVVRRRAEPAGSAGRDRPRRRPPR